MRFAAVNVGQHVYNSWEQSVLTHSLFHWLFVMARILTSNSFMFSLVAGLIVEVLFHTVLL